MITTCFRLEAGRTELNVTLRHDAYPGLEALLHGRLGSFLDLPQSAESVPPRHRVHCDWSETGVDWQDYAMEGGGNAPIGVRLSPTAWWADWCYYRASFSQTESHGLFSARHPAVEHLLRGAAVFAGMPHDLYFHAATLVYEGKAWLFAGLPNAGKSTLSREGQAEVVISNEISILSEVDGTWMALPSPFWGTGDTAQRAEPAPVAGLVVLTQSTDGNRWTPLPGVQAVAALMPHLGCQASAQLQDPALLQRLAALTGALPTWSLAWYRPSHPFEGLNWKP